MDMIKGIKGVKDILPEETPQWRFIEDAARRWALCYGYQEIRIPIFELTALFARSIGAATDIVEKEMYTFPDRDGTSLYPAPGRHSWDGPRLHRAQSGGRSAPTEVFLHRADVPP